MSSERMQSTYDPRYEGIYQRGGATEAVSRMESPAPPAPALPHEPERPVEPSAIREVAPQGLPRQDEAVPRNPYDRWLWILAGALVALGVFFLAAPMLYEQQYMEAMTSGQPGGGYINPWYNYTAAAAPVLLLTGVATAVAQLFVLSVRHTLATR
ncbi:hypothetical protein [Arthrobacter sp. B0490]|uniref:hypothetical protein n=1 Tax=Arthrobacter sp. B0490 TaxID=2058891 RepID=UPI000CE34282|nr:hypothetical protein [Arthrobacter sp. B0490]